MTNCNCKTCPYRISLARMFDVHVWKEDCDRYETEYCIDMNTETESPKGEKNDKKGTTCCPKKRME